VPLTMEVWVRINSFQGSSDTDILYLDPMVKITRTTNQTQVSFFASDGSLKFTRNAILTVWFHLAIAIDSSGTIVYLDGTSIHNSIWPLANVERIHLG
jgi:hypothetical protein